MRDDLRGESLCRWDERDDFAKAVATLLGIPRLGHDSPLSFGGTTLTVRVERDERTRRWFVNVLSGWPDDPKSSPRKSLALLEAYAMQSMRRLVKKVDGPEGARWKLRLLVATGFVTPAPVRLRELPETAPDAARRTWEVLAHLFSIRWLTEESGSPCPLSAPWLASWSGGRLTEQQAIAGKRWLSRHGHIFRVGELPSPSGGKPMIVWEAR